MVNRFKLKAYIKSEKIMCEVSNISFSGDKIEEIGVRYLSSNFDGTQEKYYTMTDDIILMQSTGLRDKNKKEIFEGDLLKIKDNIYQIIWDKDCLQYFLEKDGFKFCWSDCFDEEKRKFIVEVIGNIYENSNLIKE